MDSPATGDSHRFRVLKPGLVRVALRPASPGGPGPAYLVIETGGAFPPTHPTARLCLELLEEAQTQGPLGKAVDVGCGTGLLGLAAAALGSPWVVGLDLAGEAVRITRQNAIQNGLSGRVAVVQGSPECLRGPFEVVLANLPAEVLKKKARFLSRLAAPGGILVLSGFRESQEQELQKLFQKTGWLVSKRRVWEFSHPELPAHLSFAWVAWLLKQGGRPTVSALPGPTSRPKA